MRHIVSVLSALLLAASVATAGETSFRQFNPDIDKYEFAKSFIAALSFYSRTADRLVLEDKASVDAKTDAQAIREFINHRTLDNTELRIAKNYLIKYTESANGLIRKVALDTITTYDKLLGMSVRERSLWQAFERFRTLGIPRDFSEEEFGRQQVLLAREKKEVAKNLVLQSTFMAKVLLSAERCDTENCKELALIQTERDKLAKKLDEFAQGSMDWGMKPGQTTLQACVASLREVLEDPIYKSRSE